MWGLVLYDVGEVKILHFYLKGSWEEVLVYSQKAGPTFLCQS